MITDHSYRCKILLPEPSKVYHYITINNRSTSKKLKKLVKKNIYFYEHMTFRHRTFKQRYLRTETLMHHDSSATIMIKNRWLYTVHVFYHMLKQQFHKMCFAATIFMNFYSIWNFYGSYKFFPKIKAKVTLTIEN